MPLFIRYCYLSLFVRSFKVNGVETLAKKHTNDPEPHKMPADDKGIQLQILQQN